MPFFFLLFLRKISIQMKRFSFIILLCFAATVLQAQNNNTIRPPRPKVGVVLGGGGAKGASHIGVLKYIEEMGIPVDYVAGTSMGSIIGGLYAMGYEPDEMNRLIANINWSEYIGNKIERGVMSEEFRQRSSTLVLNVPFGQDGRLPKASSGGLISQLPSAYVINSSLVNLFNDLCVGYQEDMDFNDMPIPFACVATDLITGQEVVLRSGNVPEAMRASMAIPGVFAPVQKGDYVLVDGGLVNNFPADVLHDMGADIIIGVEITKEKQFTSEDLQSLPQVMARLLTNSTSAKREENRGMCNIYIVPDVTGYGMLSFNAEAIDTLVERGYKKAQEYHEQLLAIKQALEREVGHEVGKELRAPRAKNLENEAVTIRSIEISGVSERYGKWLDRKSGLKVGRDYSKSEIDHAINIFRGTACFDDITYTIKESDTIHWNNKLSDAYDLKINMKPAKSHIFGLGVRYDTEEGAALLLNLGLNEKEFAGSKLNLNAKLSYNPKVNLTYTYVVPSVANFNLAYDYRNEHFRIVGADNRGMNLRYYQHKASGYISQFHLLNFSTKVGLSYTNTNYDFSSMVGSFLDTLVFAQNKLVTPFVNLAYDNLDDTYFAKRGIKTSLTARYHIDLHPSEIALDEGSKGQYFCLLYDFQSYLTPRNGKFTFIPQVYGLYVSGLPMYYNRWTIYGGEVAGRHFDTQLPFVGLTSVSNAFNNSTVFRLDLRYNFYGRHYLTAMYNFMAHLQYLLYYQFSLQDVFDFGVQGAGLKYSYDSALGPVSLTAHWSKTQIGNHFGLYFSFGYTF